MAAKAVILAGGSGSRLRPLTPFIPKEMLPLAHFPIIHHVLSELFEASIQEVLVVLSEEKACLREYLTKKIIAKGDDAMCYASSRECLLDRMNISFVTQKNPLGTADAVYLARDYMAEENLLVVYPDDILLHEQGGECVTRRMVDLAEEERSSVILAEQIPLSEVSHYGIIDFAGEKNMSAVPVRGLIEKPTKYEGKKAYAMIGRMVVTPNLMKSIPDLPIEDGLGIIPALNQEAEKGKLLAILHSGIRLDVGTHDGYLHALDFYRK